MNEIEAVTEHIRLAQENGEWCKCTEHDLAYQLVCRRCGLPKQFCANWRCKRPLGECGCFNKV